MDRMHYPFVEGTTFRITALFSLNTHAPELLQTRRPFCITSLS